MALPIRYLDSTYSPSWLWTITRQRSSWAHETTCKGANNGKEPYLQVLVEIVALQFKSLRTKTLSSFLSTAHKPKFCTFPSAWGMGLGVLFSEYLTLNAFLL